MSELVSLCQGLFLTGFMFNVNYKVCAFLGPSALQDNLQGLKTNKSVRAWNPHCLFENEILKTVGMPGWSLRC